MNKEKRKLYGTLRKRIKTRRKRKIFRFFLLIFIGVVLILILRVFFKKPSVEEGATVVDLKMLQTGSESDNVRISGETGETIASDHQGFMTELQKFMRTVEEVQVAKEPYENSETVMTIPKGQYVETYGVESGYVKVRYQEKVGYLSRNELEDLKDPHLFKVVRGLLIVNRTYRLPEQYSPGLNTQAQIAFERMREDAARGGLTIQSCGDFQDYNYQAQLVQHLENSSNAQNFEKPVEEEQNLKENLENSEVEKNPAKEKPKKEIGWILPGQSEHQTGFAFDIWDGENEIGDAQVYDQYFISTWLKENAYKFGFILRYPKDKEEVTGYAYEPWHYRYVGEELAGKIFSSGLTLEEYFGLN